MKTRNSTTIDVRAMIRAAHEAAPVEDHDRADTIELLGREVIVDCPAPWPRDARTDISVKLPLRVVWDGCMGVGIEIGPYDFEAKDVQMLKQAIAFYEYHGGETWPMKTVRRGSPEAATSAATHPEPAARLNNLRAIDGKVDAPSTAGQTPVRLSVRGNV